MIIFPFFQNAFQFWITDSIIKGNEIYVEILDKKDLYDDYNYNYIYNYNHKEKNFSEILFYDLEENFEKAENNIKSYYISDH
jgi:hypothetical protein